MKALILFILWLCDGELLLYHSLNSSQGEWIINGTASVATSSTLCEVPDCVYLYSPPSMITYVGLDGNGVSTKSYTDIQLTYSVQPVNLERDEFCLVLYSLDKGRSWNTVESFGKPSNDVLKKKTSSLSAADSDSLWIRFEIDSVQRTNADYCVFDEMYVNGTPMAASQSTAAPTTTTATTTTATTMTSVSIPSIAPTNPPTGIPLVQHGQSQTIDGGSNEGNENENGKDGYLSTLTTANSNEDKTETENINSVSAAQNSFWNSNWQYFMLASVAICVICTCIIVWCLHRARPFLPKPAQIDNWSTPQRPGPRHAAGNKSASAEIIFRREQLNFPLPSPPSYTSRDEVLPQSSMNNLNMVAMQHAYDQVSTAADMDDHARPLHTLHPNQAQHGEESIDALPLPSSYQDGERDLTHTELQPMAVEEDDEWDPDDAEDEELYNFGSKSEGRATNGQQPLQHAILGGMHARSKTAGVNPYHQPDVQNAVQDNDASSDDDDEQYERMYQAAGHDDDDVEEDAISSDNDEYDKLYHKSSQTQN